MIEILSQARLLLCRLHFASVGPKSIPGNLFSCALQPNFARISPGIQYWWGVYDMTVFLSGSSQTHIDTSMPSGALTSSTLFDIVIV